MTAILQYLRLQPGYFQTVVITQFETFS